MKIWPFVVEEKNGTELLVRAFKSEIVSRPPVLGELHNYNDHWFGVVRIEERPQFDDFVVYFKPRFN